MAASGSTIPFTFWAMLVGTLAITGVGIIQIAGLPSLGFAGFFSKDAIIESAYASGTSLGGFAFFIGVFAALLTSFYSWRLIFLTFYGKPRWAASEHIQHALHGDHHDHPDAEDAGHDTHAARARARRRCPPAPAAITRTKARGRCWSRSACSRWARSLAGQLFHEALIGHHAGHDFWHGSRRLRAPSRSSAMHARAALGEAVGDERRC